VESLKLVSVVMVAGLLAMPVAGCATKGKARLTAKRMCEAAGGTYANKTCNPGAANQRTAKQMCDAHGGWYQADLDMCEVEGEP
jgi:hypothetical protein